MHQEEEKVQVRRRQAAKAIQLAMANRWEDAVTVNRAIISLFPNDSDSYNRLGKALMELGRYPDAKKAYKKALDLDATNQIARKNLNRLNALVKSGVGQAETTTVDPALFIEEMGKSTVTTLAETSPEGLAALNAGDKLELRLQGSALAVETPGGEFVGYVEPKLALRLAKLMGSGNEYAAAITSLTSDQCRMIIKETYQHPTQAGRPSFPTAAIAEGTRPYTKGSLLRYEPSADEAEEVEDAEEGAGSDENGKDAWENESGLRAGDVRLYDARAAEDRDDDELEE